MGSWGMRPMEVGSVAGRGLGRTLAGPPSFPARGDRRDVEEAVVVEPLGLLKMLKRAGEGRPFEVMGVVLGEEVEDECVLVRDVLDLPLVASTVAVDAVDPAFQLEMKELLEETGRDESFLGWYHSHPGYGAYLSAVDRDTQATFQAINPRAVALVVDPVQSVKGRVVLEAFRTVAEDPMRELLALIAPTHPRAQPRPRHASSLHGLHHLRSPDLPKLRAKGLDRHFYKLGLRTHIPPHAQRMVECLGWLGQGGGRGQGLGLGGGAGRAGTTRAGTGLCPAPAQRRTADQLDALARGLEELAQAPDGAGASAPLQASALRLLRSHLLSALRHSLLRSALRSPPTLPTLRPLPSYAPLNPHHTP